MFEFDIDPVPKVKFKDIVKIKTTRGLLDTNYKTEILVVSPYRPEVEIYRIVRYGKTAAEAETAAKAKVQEITRRVADELMRQHEDYLAALFQNREWEAETDEREWVRQTEIMQLDHNLQIFHLAKGDSNDE